MKAMMMMTMGLIGGLAAGCVTDAGDELETEAIAAGSQICRYVQRFDYNRGSSTFSWNVTTELWSGRQFVDERRYGGGFYRQYRVSPVWSWCQHANESVTLINSQATLTGTHVCLNDGTGREEYHGSDYQRLLVPKGVDINCDP